MQPYLHCLLFSPLLLLPSAQFKINNRNSTITSTPGTKPDQKIKFTDGTTADVYESLDIINYNYLDLKREADAAELTALKDALYQNSLRKTTLLTPDEIKTKSARVKELEAEIIQYQSDMDSLYYAYTKDYMNFRRAFFCNMGSLRSRAFFDIVYGNSGKTFRALGNAGLNFGSKTASVYSEIVSGNLGIFRVSLGTMIAKSASQDSAARVNDEAYQRLVSSGGNTILNLEYPVAYLHSRNYQYNFITTVNIKGTADLLAFGTDTSRWAGSGSVGLNMYGEASTSNNQLSFFFNFSLGRFYGTHQFKQNLGIANANFSFGQLSAGLVFMKNFKISLLFLPLVQIVFAQ